MSETLRSDDEQIDWIGSIPFFLVHLSPLLVIWTGFRTRDVVLCVALYFIRMFFISAGYHRYFAHRGYKMGRVMQFLVAVGGSTAAQKVFSGGLDTIGIITGTRTKRETSIHPETAFSGATWAGFFVLNTPGHRLN